MANYAQQIAALRQQRAQYDYAVQAENIKQDYAEAARLRDEAARRGDADSWHNYDRDCETLENDWARYFAPTQQQPQVDPRLTAYANRKKVFLDRHGMAAVQAMDLAHAYATRPRNPSTNNPGATGMGLQPGSPAYFKAIDDLLEMYAKDYGLKYDPKEDTVGPNEAARISGVRHDEYNNGVKQMWQMGRNSAAESAQTWMKKVG